MEHRPNPWKLLHRHIVAVREWFEAVIEVAACAEDAAAAAVAAAAA